MHSLGRPEVLRSAILAGLCSALVCWPRIATAPHQHLPVWYLEAVVLLGSIVLWGFVFAWHRQYTQRPVLTLNVAAWPLALAGLATAVFWHFEIDPWLRRRRDCTSSSPGEFPASEPTSGGNRSRANVMRSLYR